MTTNTGDWQLAIDTRARYVADTPSARKNDRLYIRKIGLVKGNKETKSGSKEVWMYFPSLNRYKWCALGNLKVLPPLRGKKW